MLQKHWKDFIIFSGILLIVLISKWSLLDVPFFYEEKPRSLVYTSYQSFLDLLTGNYNQYFLDGHKPFVPFIINKLRLLFELFGLNGTFQFKIHFIFALLSSFVLYFTFKTARVIFHLSPFNSLVIILLLFSYPDYFVHSSNYRIDIFTLIVASIYLYFRSTNHFLGFIISGVLLSQTRETVLAFILSVLIVDVYKYYKTKTSIKYLVASGSHLILFSYFFVVTFLKNDSLSVSPAYSEINSSFGAYLNILIFDLKWLFISDFRYVLTSVTVPCLYILYKRGNKFKVEYLYFVLPLIFYCLGMAFHVFEASYYLIPVLSCLYLILLFPILKVLRLRYIVLLLLLMLQLNLKSNKIKAHEQLAENSTKYVEITENYTEVSRYVSKFEGKLVNAEWPLSLYLAHSIFGYGRDHKFVKPMFEDIWAAALGHKTKVIDCNKISFDYIIVDNQSPFLKLESQKKVVRDCSYKKIKVMRKSQYVVDIYAKN